MEKIHEHCFYRMWSCSDFENWTCRFQQLTTRFLVYVFTFCFLLPEHYSSPRKCYLSGGLSYSEVAQLQLQKMCLALTTWVFSNQGWIQVQEISSIMVKLEMAKNIYLQMWKLFAAWYGKLFAIWTSSSNIHLLAFVRGKR